MIPSGTPNPFHCGSQVVAEALMRWHSNPPAFIPPSRSSLNLSGPTILGPTSSPCIARNPKSLTEIMRKSTTKTSTPLSSSSVLILLCPTPIANSKQHTGGSVLCSQLSVHHRCPIEAPARSKRDDRCLLANTDPRNQQFALPRCKPRLRHLVWPSPRDRHRPVIALRQPCNIALRRVHRDARQTMGQSISPQPRRFCRRQEPGQATEVRWIRQMALPPRHREPPGDASARPAVARLCAVAVPVDDQPHCRWGHCRHDAFRIHVICFFHSRSNALLQLPLPDTSFRPHPSRHQICSTK